MKPMMKMGDRFRGMVDSYMLDDAEAAVKAGKGDKDIQRLAHEDPNPATWVADEAIWERAKKAVDPKGKGAKNYDDPWAVVAYVYERMGGRVKG